MIFKDRNNKTVPLSSNHSSLSTWKRSYSNLQRNKCTYAVGRKEKCVWTLVCMGGGKVWSTRARETAFTHADVRSVQSQHTGRERLPLTEKNQCNFLNEGNRSQFMKISCNNGEWWDPLCTTGLQTQSAHVIHGGKLGAQNLKVKLDYFLPIYCNQCHFFVGQEWFYI